MLPELEKACRDVVYDYLIPDNVFEIYSYSVTFGDKVLYEYCHDMLRDTPWGVLYAFQTTSFLEITYETLLDMLQKNSSNFDKPWDKTELGVLLSEKELFVACHAWAIEECKRQELEPSGPNKRRVLGDCLSLIRFPCMLTSDIVQVVLPTGIFNEEEKDRLVATPPGNAQQMCPTTKQSFLVYFEQDVKTRIKNSANEIKKMRIPSKKRLLRNTVEFTAERRMVLSQIWLLPRDYGYEVEQIGRQRAKYEVVIKYNDKIQTRQSVVSQVIGTDDYPVMLLLDLKPFTLEKDGEYILKVHDKGWHDDDDRWDWPKEMYESLLSKMKVDEDADFYFSGLESNQWISGFTINHM